MCLQNPCLKRLCTTRPYCNYLSNKIELKRFFLKEWKWYDWNMCKTRTYFMQICPSKLEINSFLILVQMYIYCNIRNFNCMHVFLEYFFKKSETWCTLIINTYVLMFQVSIWKMYLYILNVVSIALEGIHKLC